MEKIHQDNVEMGHFLYDSLSRFSAEFVAADTLRIMASNGAYTHMNTVGENLGKILNHSTEETE